MKETNPEKFEKIFEEYKKVFEKAKKAIEKGDLKELSSAIEENQKLLREINVSCKELEELIEIAKSNGALSAKLTGTGRGGLMYALTPGKKLQEKTAKASEEKGFRVFKTTIGGTR